MPYRSYRAKSFRADALLLIDQCNEVIEDLMAQGFRLTLRQLYYQLVTKNIVPNVERSYRRLAALVSDARLAGRMDWDAIEDRGRQPRAASEFEDLRELVDVAVQSYRLPRWKDQKNYVELWVEKDALAGVLWPLAREFHVTLMVNRGYSSQSAMYEAANRFLEHPDQDGHLLYLGDFDPSGEDMVRDIDDRLAMFKANVWVKKIALTRDQIDEHNPPPNPAKVSDPRAAKYIARNGDESWEVDALPPSVLTSIIRDAFSDLVDEDAMAEVMKREESDKRKLRRAVALLGRK